MNLLSSAVAKGLENIDTYVLHLKQQCFLTFFDFVHPCHRFLHPHPHKCECIADVTIIVVHGMFIVRPRYLRICSTTLSTAMISAIQQIDYDHKICYDY